MNKPAIFTVFALGYALVIAGVAYAAHALGLGTQWIVVITLTMAGMGIIGALARTTHASESGDSA